MTVREFMALLPRGEFWVFGYGSLMWSPCFAYREKRLARSHGFHRALCILSTRYRGTHRKPGLVMGLCPGGSCWGMAFRIGERDVHRCLARLWRREMPRILDLLPSVWVMRSSLCGPPSAQCTSVLVR